MGRGAVSQTPWHPQGVLIAHLAEHRQGVNQLAVAANGLFFASASNDETVKVWDCRRLEKDVSFKSRLTYASQGMEDVYFKSRLTYASQGMKDVSFKSRLTYASHVITLSWLQVVKLCAAQHVRTDRA